MTNKNTDTKKEEEIMVFFKTLDIDTEEKRRKLNFNNGAFIENKTVQEDRTIIISHKSKIYNYNA
jgi:hypothetical protein